MHGKSVETLSAPPPSPGAMSWTKEARWRVALFLALAACLNFGDRSAMSAVLSTVRTEFALSDVSLGLLGSVFLWTYALCSPFAGALADRFSRTRLVIGSLAAWSAITLLVGLAHNFPVLLALRLGLGVAECIFLPAAIALIAEYHGVETRARALSFISIGVNCGLVLGASFAGFMGQHYGWRSGFWVLGLGGIALAWLGRSALPPSQPVSLTGPARGSLLDAIKYLVRVPTYHVLVAESLLSGCGMWIFFTWLPLYWKETYDLNLAAAGFAGTFILQVSVIVGIALGGWISDRAARHAPHRRLLLYSLFYLLAAPFLLLFLGRLDFTAVAAGVAAFSFLRGMGQSNDNAIQCEIVPPHLRSTAVGIMNAASAAAGGCGVFLAGFFKQQLGLAAVFASISGMFLLAGFVLLVGYRVFIRRDIARAQARSVESQ
jgi:predicted MFS family arabinose efflux permease